MDSTQTSFWQTAFGGNSVRAWMASFIILFTVMAGLWILRRLVLRHLARLASRTETKLDDLAVELLGRTRFLLVLVIGVFLASYALKLPEARVHLLRTAAAIAFIVQVAVWGNALITFWLRHYLTVTPAEDSAALTSVSTLGFLIRGAFWTVLLLLALDNLGIKVTGLITGLGVGGVAVAMAAQQLLKDLFASLAIAMDKPFLIGDTINVDTYTGTVEHIGIKTTRLRSVTGEQLIFSNSNILDSRLRNYQRMTERMVVMTVTATFESAAEQAGNIPEILRAAVESTADVRFARAHLKGFSDCGLVFETAYAVQTPDYDRHMDAQQEIHLKILRAFREHGIEVATPARRVQVVASSGERDPSIGASTEVSAGIGSGKGPEASPPG
jgi:small-conductance mechanosensitive channel